MKHPLSESMQRMLADNAEDIRDFAQADIAAAPIMKDAARLPDGRKLKDLSADELADELMELRVPGVSKENTRAANMACYAVMLRAIHEEGGGDAVSLWRLMNGSNENDDKREDEDDGKE